MTGLAGYNEGILVADEYSQKIWCVTPLSQPKAVYQYRKLLHNSTCYDLACSERGDVWVACGTSEPFAVCLGPGGSAIDQLDSSAFGSVNGLAYDDEDRLWVADQGRGLLLRLRQ